MGINFSVLLSVYNKEEPDNLRLALDSILDQILLPNEIILVLDGYINNKLLLVIDEFKNKTNLIHTIPLHKNMGLGTALQIGLESCKYEWVARMDTDDICYKDRFQVQIDFIKDNVDVSVLSCGIQEFNYEPGDLGIYRIGPTVNLKRFAKYRNPLNHVTVFFRKSHVLNAGSYQHMPYFEDYYLWIRMLVLGYKIQNITAPLVHVKIGNDMIGRRHGWQYFKHEYNFLKSIYKLHFLTLSEFYLQVIIKFPIRMLPKFISKLIYKFFLR